MGQRANLIIVRNKSYELIIVIGMRTLPKDYFGESSMPLDLPRCSKRVESYQRLRKITNLFIEKIFTRNGYCVCLHWYLVEQGYRITLGQGSDSILAMTG